MVPLLLLAAAQASAPLPAPPPYDSWGRLPRLPFASDVSLELDATLPVMQLVERRPECRASGVPVPSIASSRNVPIRGVSVSLAVLVAPDGRLLNVVAGPRPCNAIRNHVRALARRRFEGRVRPPGGSGPVWYRTGLSFSWGP